jgi:cell division protease FtsH
MKKSASLLPSPPTRPGWHPHAGQEVTEIGGGLIAPGVPLPDSVGKGHIKIGTDIVAASVALEAALPAGLIKTFGREECLTLVLQVPTAGWCVPVRKALFRLLDEQQGPRGLSQEICTIVRDGSERGLRPTSGDDEIVIALTEGRSALGISPDPKRLLPRALGVAPDICVIVRPLTGAQMREVIAAVTGCKGRPSLTDGAVAGLDPTDIAIAVRTGSTPSDCEARMLKFAAARVEAIGDDVPMLQDLHGCDEARDWGLGLAKDIALYRKGLLDWKLVAEVGSVMCGPPGCGKTQIAGSLSRTLGIPLISTSYAAWQAHRDGHLNDVLGAMRRSLMEARAITPAIWFIDEVDSLPNRAAGDMHYREWYVAVVNALLELSERAARPGVILLGACNDVSRMDAALMRPGRFGDRIITVPYPDADALAGILRHHLAGDLANMDLMPFAQCALGSTGANIAEWVRGAKRAARNEGRPIGPADLMLQISPDDDRSHSDIRRAAIHEAGHCAALALTGQKVDFVSIRKSAGVGGKTTAPRLGTDFPTREDFERTVIVLLAGRAAEEVLLGTPSASASGGPHSDLPRATDIVVGMHASFGLGKSPAVHVHFREASRMLQADANLRLAVDEHMTDLYQRALAVISDNTRAVQLVAERLIAVRHLGWDEIQTLIRTTAVIGLKSNSTVPDQPAAGNLTLKGSAP